MVKEIEASLQLCAARLDFVQPQPPDTSSELLTLRSKPEGPPQNVQLPISDAVKDIWTKARGLKFTKPYKVVPPATLQSFRLPPADWAFLGAVRRPDETLRLHSNVTLNQRQVPVLKHKEKSATELDSLCETIVQSTAHTSRPVVHSIHAIKAGYEMLQHTISTFQSITSDKLTWFEAVKNMMRHTSTAVVEATEAQARLNAYTLRKLRDSWTESLWPL